MSFICDATVTEWHSLIHVLKRWYIACADIMRNTETTIKPRTEN